VNDRWTVNSESPPPRQDSTEAENGKNKTEAENGKNKTCSDKQKLCLHSDTLPLKSFLDRKENNKPMNAANDTGNVIIPTNNTPASNLTPATHPGVINIQELMIDSSMRSKKSNIIMSCIDPLNLKSSNSDKSPFKPYVHPSIM